MSSSMSICSSNGLSPISAAKAEDFFEDGSVCIRSSLAFVGATLNTHHLGEQGEVTPDEVGPPLGAPEGLGGRLGWIVGHCPFYQLAWFLSLEAGYFCLSTNSESEVTAPRNADSSALSRRATRKEFFVHRKRFDASKKICLDEAS